MCPSTYLYILPICLTPSASWKPASQVCWTARTHVIRILDKPGTFQTRKNFRNIETRIYMVILSVQVCLYWQSYGWCKCVYFPDLDLFKSRSAYLNGCINIFTKTASINGPCGAKMRLLRPLWLSYRKKDWWAGPGQSPLQLGLCLLVWHDKDRKRHIFATHASSGAWYWRCISSWRV